VIAIAIAIASIAIASIAIAIAIELAIEARWGTSTKDKGDNCFFCAWPRAF